MSLSTNNHFSSSLSQNLIILTNFHSSRKLLLQPPAAGAGAGAGAVEVVASPPNNDLLYPLSRPGNTRFEANVIMVISVLLGALLFSLCINTLIRCMLKFSGVMNHTHTHTHTHTHLILTNQQHTNNNNKPGCCGVDTRALMTIPVMKCSKELKIINQGLGTECVICLSEFEGEEELVRILPKCHHVFHVMCIDKWLSSHSSCPTCRQSLFGTSHHQTSPPNHVLPLQREGFVRNYWL